MTSFVVLLWSARFDTFLWCHRSSLVLGLQLAMAIPIERGFIIVLLPLVASSSICVKKPSLIQCVALKNQYILPIKESCNPLKKDCQAGDLVDPRVANCHLELSGNTFHSLLEGFKLSSGYRCFPIVPEPDLFHRRNVGPSFGEPRCVPTKYNRLGSFVCGDHGTRCVCDAPPETGYAESWWRNTCRYYNRIPPTWPRIF